MSNIQKLLEKIVYAHSRPGKPPEEWQPLEEHLKAVADKAAEFAADFQSADWAWNAGWLHDVGKATNAFQKYLSKSNGLDDSSYDDDGSMSNHASAGAMLASQTLGDCVGRILAYISTGHHAGLPDWYTVDAGNAALPKRLEEGRKNLEYIKSFAKDIVSRLRPLRCPPDFVKKPGHFHLWVRMIFSCLVDADYLNTECFVAPEKAVFRDGYPSLQHLAKRFFDALYKLEKSASLTSVNIIRSEIRQACEKKANDPRGFFSLEVPTGGGKTFSAMAFAFRHALKHGHRRVIYVIPYTSIIEQTAQALSKFVGKENVVEHHSNLEPDRESQRSRLAAENWDAPVIVTTNVQFFESLYAAKSSRCRKLHNIVNSVVILDEAQLLSPRWLSPCVDVMNQLVQNYGVTMVLATATQPALNSLPPPCPNLDPPTAIIPSEMNLYERLKRVDYGLPVDWIKGNDWQDIAERLQRHEQVLCIVNTRRDCHDLFKLMPKGTMYLSALMCGKHRSEKIAEIKKRLKDGLPTRVISTQLVEAGVDIDFPVVYRALTGLDSIAQAAGRCNREGRLNESNRFGQVYVFIPPNPSPSGLLLKGEQSAREMASLPEFDLHTTDTFNRYFRLFYSAVNDTGMDWLIGRLIRDAAPALHFQFRTADREFNIIDQAQRPVFVRYGDSDKWLDELRRIGPTRQNMRLLQRYVVNLRENNFRKAVENGLVEQIRDGYWCWALKYDPEIGLNIFTGGWTPEDLNQ